MLFNYTYQDIDHTIAFVGCSQEPLSQYWIEPKMTSQSVDLSLPFIDVIDFLVNKTLEDEGKEKLILTFITRNKFNS